MKMKPTGSKSPASLRCWAGQTTIAILLIATAIFAAGCANLNQPPGSTRDASSKSSASTTTEPVSHRDIQRDKEVVLRAHREVWSRGNMDAVKEIAIVAPPLLTCQEDRGFLPLMPSSFDWSTPILWETPSGQESASFLQQATRNRVQNGMVKPRH
jgi:hypothetical protein